MYFQAPVIMKGREKYYHEINIDESYDGAIVDEWGAAYVWNKKGEGAEYHIFFDGRCEKSVICKADEYKTYDEYEYYEIDFSLPDWKERLINAMIDCVDRWWNGTGKE